MPAPEAGSILGGLRFERFVAELYDTGADRASSGCIGLDHHAAGLARVFQASTSMIDLETIEGLSTAQAAEQLARDGFNELAAGRIRPLWRELLDVAREPMTALLIGCGVIYFVLGDRSEAVMLLGFVLLIVGTTLYQERKTERAIEALRDLASPRALVIRDGQQQRIAGHGVTVGEYDQAIRRSGSVSYTHLTLPTSALV